jgi:hypothetical protein
LNRIRLDGAFDGKMRVSMIVSEQLDQLGVQFPDCDIAAFADLSTGMVLSARVVGKVSQERLDELCMSAMDVLDGQTADNVTRTMWPKSSDRIRCAVRFQTDQVELFLRSAQMPEDALCLVCATKVDLPALISVAEDTLSRIETGH